MRGKSNVWFSLLVGVTLGVGLVGSQHGNFDSSPHHGRCEDIVIQLCKGLQYNQTIMPNILDHQRQEDAGLEVQQYAPLVKIKCSPMIQIFLCSLYFPVCTILDKPLPPCRSLCTSARYGCETLLNSFGYAWPDYFNCDKFPETGKDDLCFGENHTISNTPPPNPLGFPRNGYVGRRPGDDHLSFPPEGGKDFGFVCPIQFKVPKGQNYSFRVGDKVEKDCGAPCDVLTFMIDTERFKYPERPIIFLSVCYLMVSVVYVIGFFAGNSIACREPFPPPLDLPNLKMVSTITQGTKHEFCTILFMVLYFFSMASSIWWVVLTLTWFLAAGLKWGHEAIEANSHYFHLAAWAVPAIKTITILAMGNVEGRIVSLLSD
ncbi:UNVERIFIED_CONTAM: hypothetical protein PYX00_006361 [Menopon gallinae]|uniref:Uncharacterized protein n=1 Tax=Menopon gallinae TaxID=328185 RepID=A0AAW2HVV8_9NEOP